MKNKIISLILVASCVALLSGCASIVHGTKQKESFRSVPSGAKILIDNVSYGKTPKTISLSRSSEHTITIRLPGYQPATFKLTRRVSGWFFGNLIIGGIIGIVIDAADGAIYQLKPGQVNTTTGDRVQLGKKDTITVILMKHVQHNNQLRKIGQLGHQA